MNRNTVHSLMNTGRMGLGIALGLLTGLLASSGSLAGEVNLLRGDSRKPYDSIQKALDAALPGDIVELDAGTYHESVRFSRSGEEGRPITLRGREGVRPILDGADPAFQQVPNNLWQENEADGVKYFTARAPFVGEFPGRALCTWVSFQNVSGTNRCEKLIAAYASLKALLDGSRGEGSFRKGAEIAVRLDSGINPGLVPLNIGKSETVVDIGTQSHIRIHNLEVRNAGWSAIDAGTAKQDEISESMADFDEESLQLPVAEKIEITDCVIRNSFRGINIGKGGVRELVVRGVVIANGTPSGWPWNGGYTGGIGEAMGNSSDDLAPWRGFGIRLVNVHKGDISKSVIEGQWDGMGVKKSSHVRIHHNTLRNLMDDGIELESSDQSDIEFFNNHLYNVFAGISVTSNYPGPIYIYRNVVEATHPGGRGYTPSYGIKSGHDSLGRAENIKFYQNTFFGNSFNLWEKLGDPHPNRWQGYDFVNNIFFTSSDTRTNYNFRGVDAEDSGPDNHWEGNVYNKSNPKEKNAVIDAALIEQFVRPESTDPTVPRNLDLIPESPLRTAGSDYPGSKGWPDSVKEFPSGRSRGAWEEEMTVEDIGAPPGLLF